MGAISEANRKWWLLAAMSGVMGLVVLDETVVGVALATIQPDLGMTTVGSHWVVNAYFLTFTCFVAVGGRLGDAIGQRDLFLLGVTIFGLASLAAGFAQDGAWLIAARAVQGVGGAIIFPTSLAAITSTFALEKRGMALGIQTTVGATFMSLGPLVGGFFSESVSWRWVFWINLPVVIVIGAIALIGWTTARPTKKPAEAKTSHGVDYPGLVALVAGLSAVVIAMMQGSDWGWLAAKTVSFFAAGIVLLVGFVVVELRRTKPLFELTLLRIRTFTGGNLVFFVFQWSKLAVFVFVALYLQDVLHDSPIDAGLIVLVAVAPTIATSLFGGKTADRFGSRVPLSIGLLLQGIALIVVGIGMYQQSHGVIIAALIVWGAAMPIVAVPARRAVMSSVPATHRGQAGGINLTLQMLGGTIGVALCSTLLLATHDYGSLFFMTGGALLVVMIVAWLTVERHAQTE